MTVTAAPRVVRRAPARVLAALLAALLVQAAAAAGTAQAHSAFVGAQPAPGTRLEVAPGRVVLTFTEPVNRSLSRAEVVSADGSPVGRVAQGAEARRLLLRPGTELPTGPYRVRWHTVSTEDGHALEGSFAFGVRAAAVGGAQALEESPLARSGWLRVLLRGGLYATLVLLTGAVLVPELIRGPRASWLALGGAEATAPDSEAVVRRERRTVENTAWCALLLAIATILAETSDAAGSLSLTALADYLTTSTAGVARIVLVAALGVSAIAGAHRRRVSAAAVVLALGVIALSGHAGSAVPRTPTVLNDWLHLVAGGVWLGGISMLVLAWWPRLRRGPASLRDAVATEVLPPFGRVALPAFCLVTATGLVNLVVQLGHVDALWRTGYGQVLLVKIALVGVIASFSAVHAFRLRPAIIATTTSARAARHHWGLLRSEPLVGLTVVGVVALLVAFPLPPRQLGDADEAVASQRACDPCPLPAPAAGELAVADHAGPLVVAGWVRRRAGATSGTIRVYDQTTTPARAGIEVVGFRGRGCGMGCWRFDGRARPEISVRIRARGRSWSTVLPATWEPGGAQSGRRLLERAQATMRRLDSVRQVEDVTSGPGTGARTTYRLRAPDRFAFRTDRGVQTVVIGTRQWLRTRATPWRRSPYGSGIPFSLRQWFRWTVYAPHVRLLGRRTVGRARFAELALMDPATPAWIRLTIDEAIGRVVSERMVSQKHFTRSRYSGFDRPVSVEAPPAG